MERVSMSFNSSAPPGAGDVQALCMLPQSLGVHELWSCCFRGTFWCPLSSLGLTLHHFLQGSLTLEGRGLMKTSSLGLSVPRSLSLLVSGCGCVFVSMCCRNKLWSWLNKVLIYECSRMSSLRFLVYAGHGFHFMEWLLNTRYWLVTLISFVPPLP